MDSCGDSWLINTYMKHAIKWRNYCLSQEIVIREWRTPIDDSWWVPKSIMRELSLWRACIEEMKTKWRVQDIIIMKSEANIQCWPIQSANIVFKLANQEEYMMYCVGSSVLCGMARTNNLLLVCRILLGGPSPYVFQLCYV
jgi:hypothetical protein